jgi:hypothetical protein
MRLAAPRATVGAMDAPAVTRRPARSRPLPRRRARQRPPAPRGLTLESILSRWQRALDAADRALDAAAISLSAAELSQRRGELVRERRDTETLLENIARAARTRTEALIPAG